MFTEVPRSRMTTLNTNDSLHIQCTATLLTHITITGASDVLKGSTKKYHNPDICIDEWTSTVRWATDDTELRKSANGAVVECHAGRHTRTTTVTVICKSGQVSYRNFQCIFAIIANNTGTE